MSFENIIGNDKVKNFLDKSFTDNHILHSYLFVGIEGIGKILFAREFAKKILCIDGREDCTSCIKFNSDNHPDFEQIEPDSGSIKIDQIRQMQDQIAQKPIVSTKKVYIIRDADTMTKEAQNCLLKTLEEPPEYAVIILIATNESKLLTTVKSRCMKITFENIEQSKIDNYINNNYKDINEKLLSMAGGSIGKAINLLENKEIYENVNYLIDSIENHDLISTFNSAEVLYKQKDSINEILEYINTYLYNSKQMKKINCIKYVEDTKKRLLTNSNYDMSIDYLLIRMWEEINEKYSRSSI